MLNYLICEVSGKQYKVIPGKAFEVDFLGEDQKEIEAKVLVSSEDGKLKIGKPYLEETVKLICLEMTRAKKIRVAKFHAKANYRRATGHRAKLTKVILDVKKVN